MRTLSIQPPVYYSQQVCLPRVTALDRFHCSSIILHMYLFLPYFLHLPVPQITISVYTPPFVSLFTDEGSLATSLTWSSCAGAEEARDDKVGASGYTMMKAAIVLPKYLIYVFHQPGQCFW